MFLSSSGLILGVIQVLITGSQPMPQLTTSDDACVDISPNCASNAFQCHNYTYVQENCIKTCDLCITKRVEKFKCPSPWFRLGEQCFLLVKEMEEIRNWTAARAYCQEQASDLAKADLAQPRDLGALSDYMLDNGHATVAWSNTTLGCIRDHIDKALSNITSFDDCKEACVLERDFVCRSTEYFPPDQECQLSRATTSFADTDYVEPCYSPWEETLYAEIVIDGYWLGYWLGGSDLATEGEWRWISGANITSGWRKGEPNNDRGAENCLILSMYQIAEYGANSLNDIPCWENASFICERH